MHEQADVTTIVHIVFNLTISKYAIAILWKDPSV